MLRSVQLLVLLSYGTVVPGKNVLTKIHNSNFSLLLGKMVIFLNVKEIAFWLLF